MGLKVHKSYGSTGIRTACGRFGIGPKVTETWKRVTCLRCLATIAHVDCNCEKCVKGGWKN